MYDVFIMVGGKNDHGKKPIHFFLQIITYYTKIFYIILYHFI